MTKQPDPTLDELARMYREGGPHTLELLFGAAADPCYGADVQGTVVLPSRYERKLEPCVAEIKGVAEDEKERLGETVEAEPEP